MNKLLIQSFSILTLFLFTMATTIKKESFYTAYKSTDETVLKNCMNKLEEESTSNTKKAYLGALTMKSAEHKFSPISKLSAFNKGKDLLESAISSAPNNAEFRFIRLTIQENCPSILGYSSNISEDKSKVVSNYHSMDSYLKKFILSYTINKSTNLSKDELK